MFLSLAAVQEVESHMPYIGSGSCHRVLGGEMCPGILEAQTEAKMSTCNLFSVTDAATSFVPKKNVLIFERLLSLQTRRKGWFSHHIVEMVRVGFHGHAY